MHQTARVQHSKRAPPLMLSGQTPEHSRCRVSEAAVKKRARILIDPARSGPYFAGLLLLVSMILLAHSRIAAITGDAFARQTYVLYLQVSLEPTTNNS